MVRSERGEIQIPSKGRPTPKTVSAPKIRKDAEAFEGRETCDQATDSCPFYSERDARRSAISADFFGELATMHSVSLLALKIQLRMGKCE